MVFILCGGEKFMDLLILLTSLLFPIAGFLLLIAYIQIRREKNHVYLIITGCILGFISLLYPLLINNLLKLRGFSLIFLIGFVITLAVTWLEKKK